MNKLLNLLLRGSLVVFILACSTPYEKGANEVENLFNKGIAQKNERSYLLAIDTLNELKTKFSYSSYAKKAELALADIEFERKQYAQASALYRIYKDSHPRDAQIPYVLLQIGESFRLQAKKGHDRDLAGVINAIGFYQAILNDYPTSEFAETAETMLKESTQRLKDKEIYQADFYFKFKQYQSARYRYKDLLKRFDEDEIIIKSMERIVFSSFKLKEYDKCKEFADLYKKQFELNGWNSSNIKDTKESCQRAERKQEAKDGESA